VSGNTIKSVADAVAGVSKVAYELIHKKKRDLIAAEYRAAERDMQDFCRAVLQRDGGRCSLLIHGLRHDGPLPKLTAREVSQLQQIIPGIDGATLARLYILGREGDFAARVRDILLTEEK
jgi:hypothetical protein